MGWNSWDCYGPTVTEQEVRANADYMVAHLKECGWEYVVVDIRWYVENDKAHGYNEKDPIITIDDGHHINDTFLDNVRVPRANLIGEMDKGWTYAKYLLQNATISNKTLIN